MVLETSWETPTGWVVIRDVLSIGPWHEERGALAAPTAARPTDYEADNVLVRTVKCVQGSVEIHLDCEPAFDYGGLAAEWSYTGSGYHEAVASSEGMATKLRLVTDLRLGLEGPRARARTSLRAGGDALRRPGLGRAGRSPRPTTRPTPGSSRTAQYWQEWLQHGSFPDHRWRPYLQRSALTLKGLSYAPTGAMIAAATTSLPETPGGERNWDYRYSWIRDSTFMLWGLYMLGFEWEANDYFYFIADVAEAEEGDLQIMYGIDGESRLDEQILDHLTGYDGARPVRVGQRRLQPAPERRVGRRAGLDLPARQVARPPPRAHVADPEAPGGGRARRTGASRTAASGRCAASRKHFTSSKLMCWVAADRGARLARLRDDERVRRALAGRRGRDPRGHLRERARRARRLHPALRAPRRSTPRCC